MMNNLPKSPCIRNCCLNKQDICMGCFRSLAEIIAWGNADAEERRRTLSRAQQRRRRWEATLPADKPW